MLYECMLWFTDTKVVYLLHYRGMHACCVMFYGYVFNRKSKQDIFIILVHLITLIRFEL